MGIVKNMSAAWNPYMIVQSHKITLCAIIWLELSKNLPMIINREVWVVNEMGEKNNDFHNSNFRFQLI